MKQKLFIVDLFDENAFSSNAFDQSIDADFHSSDNEAHLLFKPLRQDFIADSATIALYNTQDKTLVSESTSKAYFNIVDGVAIYKIPTSIIAHWGKWNAQVIFTKGTKNYTTPKIHFEVDRYLMDERPPKLEMVESWSILYTNAFELLADFEEKYDGLEAEYATELTSVKSQLAQTTMKELTRNIIDSTGVNIARKANARPLVTFIDDDGDIEVYTRLKPIFESRGVPCTIAIVSDWVGKQNPNSSSGNHMSREQIMELQDLGWEVASHEKTHIGMSGVADTKTIYDETVQSKSDLIKMGFDVKNLVYPYGQRNDEVVKVAQTVYKNAVATNDVANASTNQSPLNNFGLWRVALGSYAGNTDTLEHHKSVIDKAISENSWVIFMTHVWAQTTEKDQLVADVLDYTISQNVEVVNFDEGLDVFGDRMTIPNVFRITPDDKMLSDSLVIGVKADKNRHTADSPITDFEKGNITYTEISPGATAEGFPESSGGTLITNRTGSTSYEWQEYRRVNSPRKYERLWKGASLGWSDWQMVATRLKMVASNQIIGEISPHSTKIVSVDVPGAVAWDTVLVSPTSTPVNGIIWSARATLNKVHIHVANVTPNTVNVTQHNWAISVFNSNV